MFIKKLYQYNKALCVSFVAYILLFVLINYKWGVVATPVLQYGMYSSTYYTSDTQTVAQVYINDKLLDYTGYSAPQRDLIITNLDLYLREKEINNASFITMKRILSKVGIGKLMQEQVYSNQITDEYFISWYKDLLEKITGEEMHKLEVYNQRYLWNGAYLAPVMGPDKIDNIAVK